jgi:hypothetical protein
MLQQCWIGKNDGPSTSTVARRRGRGMCDWRAGVRCKSASCQCILLSRRLVVWVRVLGMARSRRMWPCSTRQGREGSWSLA